MNFTKGYISTNKLKNISGILGLHFVLWDYFNLCSGYGTYVDKMVNYGITLEGGLIQYIRVNRDYKEDELIKIGENTYVTDIPTTIADMLEYDLGNCCMLDEAFWWLAEENPEMIEKARQKAIERGLDIEFLDKIIEDSKTLEF